ncbi:developmentally-regulated protein kinase 1-like [Lolium rigidum]|uniref:developmentally-regulated protein kinase 1-like n=1 Tax=Lolium rigidum TaxID=89674 RepID=UPI001F5CD240|nr:developmentally-regulated protein kinase 1-like [Lolium rigidum]
MSVPGVVGRHQRRLILRHGMGAISSLKLPWFSDDVEYDIADPSTLLPVDDQDINNLLAFDKRTKTWGTFLSPDETVMNRFKTDILPLPSSYPEGCNNHFMQLLIFRNQYCGWLSTYKIKEGADMYVADSMATFDVQPIISENAKVHRPYKESDFEYFRGCITPSIASYLRTSIKDYEREKEMVKGIQGDLFVGYCMVTRKKVMMKRMKLPLFHPNGEPREVVFTKNVASPFIRKIHAAWIDDKGIAWIVLDHIKMTLWDFLEQNKEFDSSKRLAIFRRIGNAAKYLHGENVVYVDLDLGNVLVTEDHEALLADLGSCVLLEDKQCQPSAFQSWNWLYQAPELKNHRVHDEKVDSWGLGWHYFVDMTSRYFTEDEWKTRNDDFDTLITSPKWKKDRLAAWNESKLSKDFEGNTDVLFSMIETDSVRRAGIQEILKKA